MARFHPHEVDEVLTSLRRKIRERVYALEAEPLRDFVDMYDPVDICRDMISAAKATDPGLALLTLVDKLVNDYAEDRVTETDAINQLNEEYACA